MEEEECMICLEVLDGEIAEISCSHVFHYKCIQDWMNVKKKFNRCCCICDNDTEIVNIVNLNKSFDKFKDINIGNNYQNNNNCQRNNQNNNNYQNNNYPIINVNNMNNGNNKKYKCCSIL